MISKRNFLIIIETRSNGKLYHDYAKWFRKQDRENSDVVFLIQNMKQTNVRLLYAHKFIIQTMCPELYSLIKEAEMKQEKEGKTEEQTEVLILQDDQPVSFGVFALFVDFLYTYSLQIVKQKWDNLMLKQLYHLAKRFKCTVLQNLLEDNVSLECIANSHPIIQLQSTFYKFITGKLGTPPPKHGIVHLKFSSGSVLYVHKGLLCNRCQYFKGVFNEYFSEGRTNIVEVNEELNERTMEILLEYFYTGLIPDVTVEESIPLYYAVVLFGVDPLKPFLR